MNFAPFQALIAAQVAAFGDRPLFRTNMPADVLWAMYLRSFPAGTDPKFRVRTEHDCSCCRHFIRDLGGVVTIDPETGELTSIWGRAAAAPASELDPAYAAVARALDDAVRSRAVTGRALFRNALVGTPRSLELIDGKPHRWEHFHAHVHSVNVVPPPTSIEALAGDLEAKRGLLVRGLQTITLQACQEVLDLIAQDSLLRGDQYRFAVEEFAKLLAQDAARAPAARRAQTTSWPMAVALPDAVARIRNTAIGTLLVALSGGADIEVAVRAYETIVGGANYKRPKALATPAMMKRARDALVEAGLAGALERRYATMEDLTVDNALYIDRGPRNAPAARSALDELVDSEVAYAAPGARALAGVVELDVDKFLADVLPGARMIELLFEPDHACNLVSLTAAADPSAPGLFTWDNGFAWSYAGDFADAVRERVKDAGGNVTGALCIRLAWETRDDLDLSLAHPDAKTVTSFFNKRPFGPGVGQLDLDANVSAASATLTPAENIFFSAADDIRVGEYLIGVKTFAKRDNASPSTEFALTVEHMGRAHHFAGQIPNGKRMATLGMRFDAGMEMHLHDAVGMAPRASVALAGGEAWGLAVGRLHRVAAVVKSPNVWGEKPRGTEHVFFMLDGCANPNEVRGFYNEFLSPALAPHRKALELFGAKLLAAPADRQLSGVGFVRSRRASVVLRVTGAFRRLIRVNF